MTTGFTITEITTAEQLSAVLAIREQVFIREQAIPEELEHDGLDAASRHIIACRDTVPVATARLTVRPDRTAVLSRVAVLPEYRGRGLGRMLVRKLEEIAAADKVTSIVLQPHARLEPFYAELGYHRIEGTQMVGDNPLIRMRKQLDEVARVPPRYRDN